MVAVGTRVPCRANSATEPEEPRYLETLWKATLDESLGDGERTALEAKYFDLYTTWKTIQARLAIAITSLDRSDFWKSVTEALRDHWVRGDGGPLACVEEIVCLCLGRLEDNATIHQLSLLVLLAGKLGIRHEKCFIFDPCHSPQDIDILKHLGFTVLNVNHHARIRVHRMTLFYMPHGDYHLTNNLIETNWPSLHLIAILGNNFAWVCDSKADRFHAKKRRVATSRAPHVQKVLTLVKETHLPDTFASTVRMHLASLVPVASRAVGTGLVNFLDCTLSTFPPKAQRQAIEWPFEPPSLGFSMYDSKL